MSRPGGTYERPNSKMKIRARRFLAGMLSFDTMNMGKSARIRSKTRLIVYTHVWFIEKYEKLHRRSVSNGSLIAEMGSQMKPGVIVKTMM